MKKYLIPQHDGALSRTILSSPSSNHTVRTVKVNYDGYDFSLTIIKPFCHNLEKNELSVFLFVPSISHSPASMISTIEVASQLAMASGQAAIIMNNEASYKSVKAIFELFAAMKWIHFNGEEVGINGNKMALVGFQLGANVAAILSLMALYDNYMEIRFQILIDPKFFISQRLAADRPMHFRSESEINEQEWVSINSIYNLPLDTKLADLSGSPPTLVHLSKNTGNHFELEYYCIKLIHAGTAVTYFRYEEDVGELDNIKVLQLNGTLIASTAAELRKLGLELSHDVNNQKNPHLYQDSNENTP